MKAQKPAAGISLTHEFSNASSYRIDCDCSDNDHAVIMWIEANTDHDHDYINVSFYVKTWTPFWETGFSRIKTAWNVLTKGSHQQEHHLILNAKSAYNLSSLLNSKIKELTIK